MNPAITIAFAAVGGLSWRKVAPYICAQLIGAFLAAGVLYALFHNIIVQYEMAKGLIRGAPGSELSGMIYGEYFPNPGMLGTRSAALAAITVWQAMFAEGIGTAFLAFFVFAVTDKRNPGRPNGTLPALFIGLAVSIIISVIAPLTQAGLNPARDFGPRLFAYFAGWGNVAIPGPRGGFFTVYILAPILGGLIGGAVYQRVIRPSFLTLVEQQEALESDGIHEDIRV
jgi:glycerol uptake facilitator protein